MKLLELKPYTKELNLLIAEDESAVRFMLETSFGRLFKSVKSACDGAEALEMFNSKESSFDIIITDINMPNMNGMELTRAIREINPVIPIIILSAHYDNGYLMEAINAGASGFLTKPLDYDAANKILYPHAVYATDHKVITQYQEILELQNIELLKKIEALERADRKLSAGIYVRSVSENTASHTPAMTFVDPLAVFVSMEYHHTLSDEDIYELVDLTEEIEHSVFSSIQNNHINPQQLDKLSAGFRKFGNIIYRYPIFGMLAASLFTLSKVIEEKQDRFIEKQAYAMPFMENLVCVLQKYVKDIWVNVAPNPNFYDASMINDIETFLMLLDDAPATTGDMEDCLELF
jgi:YesN/AraC family two-component response regulator